MTWSRDEIAQRAAQEIVEGSIVNLGIGLPTLVPTYLKHKQDIWLHTENGLLGMGPFPFDDEVDPHIINAGKQTVTIVPGGSCFDSATSFGMIRGGHVDIALLGAMQVSHTGDLANWAIPGGKTFGIGGAMDLGAGAKKIVVLMTHLTKKGQPKLVQNCDYPLTAQQVVTRVITDLGVFDPHPEGFLVRELAKGITPEHANAHTQASLIFD